MRSLFVCSLFLLFTSLQGTAQSSSLVEIGFGPGVSIYQGDLSPNPIGSINKPNFSLQALVNYNFHPAFALRGSYLFTTLRDDERTYGTYRPYRNLAFRASVNELSAQLILNPRANNGDEQVGELTPYVFGGLGLAFLRIERDWSRFNHEFFEQYAQAWVRPGLGIDTTTALPTSAVTMPVGLGLRYFFGENVSLYAEASHRFTRTDYLDGFSRVARPNMKDGFSSIIFGLIFRLSESGGRKGRGGYGCPVNVY